MIEAEHEGLMQASASAGKRRRGGPLAMLIMVAAVWVGGRAALWENPFPADNLINDAAALFADGADAGEGLLSIPSLAQSGGGDPGPAFVFDLKRPNGGADQLALAPFTAPTEAFAFPASPARTAMSGGHYALLRAALTDDPPGVGWRRMQSGFAQRSSDHQSRGVSPAYPPFETNAEQKAKINRWSLDAWAFWREGSDAAPISQGRVPVYGASQAGAILQYRFDPGSKRDVRAYLRAYRALVDRAETEVAAGVSARPVGDVPIRVAGELRLTDNRFDRRIRPAAYAVTEIPPVSLPFDLSAEVYGGAGYVAGEGDTLFVDGQANLTRQVARFGPEGRDAVKVSVGAGTWGGAQRDANRIDVGPTVRLDMAVGSVPARLSIDWRERVGGDASPVSGLAATLSTSF